MKGVSYWFFATAALCVLIGMFWGILMAATGDHYLSPAHAHLNLVGWVNMALFGVFYHLVPSAVTKLAKIHYFVALAGVSTMVPGIVIARLDGGDALAIVGSLLTVLSMLIFTLTVARSGRVAPTQ